MWSPFHEPDQVSNAFLRSYENLNISYVDLFLIHYPVSYGRVHKDGSGKIPQDVDDVRPFPRYENNTAVYIDVNLNDTWQAMEELVRSKRVRSIGISNFNSKQIERINAFATIRPVSNQFECHPNLNQLKLIEFSKSQNLQVTAYSPLGRPHVTAGNNWAMRHPKVQRIANNYNKTSAQIILRYTVRVESSFFSFKFNLSSWPNMFHVLRFTF